MLKYKIYLDEIRESISDLKKTNALIIIKRIKNKGIKNTQDILVKNSTLMRLQVIGESVRKLPKDITKKYSNVKWAELTLMRHFISHTYSTVPYEQVIDLLENEIPKLGEALKSIK
ncbi:DUF86 domain-containing protein [Candidatus Pacearchaeota archaeon]|nr:DUF86 domain-containing protein [Candidatus Pacearchaeota archaeon]